MENEIKVNASTNEKGELIIRQGQALPAREPVPTRISGVIDTVSKFLEKRKQFINLNESHVIVERDELSISLALDENSYYGGSVIGTLQMNSDLEKFKVNTGEYWSPKKLSEFVKMNRSFFKSKSIAMKLSTELQGIKVKVNKELEKADNNRGDYKVMLSQEVIKSNIPEGFELFIPIFKGEEKVEFFVEIYVDPETYSVSLVSPDMNDIIQSKRDELIDAEIKRIKDLAEPLLITEK